MSSENTILEWEDTSYPLKVVTLGAFEIYRFGEPLGFSRKAQQKPMELLKALIALGGRDVKEETLTDAIWPDADGDAAHRAFATTLHRLRRLTGAEKAISLFDGRLSLDQRYCNVDVWVFERVAQKADAAIRAKDMDEAERNVEKARALYRGNFLSSDANKAWTVALRERLKSKMLRLISAMGCYFEETADYRKAIYWFQNGLELDALTEEFYQHLMVCYNVQGFRSEAIAVYNRFKNSLSATLGIHPSSKTEAIYKSLLEE